jgi:hypothetical protein
MNDTHHEFFQEQLMAAHKYLFCRDTDDPPVLNKCIRCGVCQPDHTYQLHMKGRLIKGKYNQEPVLLIFHGMFHAVFEWEGKLCDQCVVDFHRFLKRE